MECALFARGKEIKKDADNAHLVIQHLEDQLQALSQKSERTVGDQSLKVKSKCSFFKVGNGSGFP